MEMVYIVVFIGFLIAFRAMEVKEFLTKVSKVCHDYDWQYAQYEGLKDNDIVMEITFNANYHLENKWSAHQFMYMNGPSPLRMFLSIKPLTIETQYNNKVIDRLRKYENIGSV